MLGSFCQDFTLRVGRVDVTVHYFSDRVCWEASGQQFCYGADMIIEFREFINSMVDARASITEIVNEFQSYFAVRRQRAFWIVETMLSKEWCVLEVVVNPGCITDGEYVLATVEWRKCFEHAIDVEDMRDYFLSAMHQRDIKLLDHCGPGAKYVPLHIRYVPLGETDCSKVETDYEAWINSVLNEAESILFGG